MGFNVLSKDLWYVLPNSVKLGPVAYFVFVFYLYVSPDFITDAFGADVANTIGATNPFQLFCVLSLIYWTSFVSSVASTILTRSNAIKDDCTGELVEQYLKIRPLGSASVDERNARWERLADNLNRYIHSDLKSYDKSVMSRFNFTSQELEDHVVKLIREFSAKNKTTTTGKDEVEDDKHKAMVKLIEAHFKDGSVIVNNATGK